MSSRSWTYMRGGKSVTFMDKVDEESKARAREEHDRVVQRGEEELKDKFEEFLGSSLPLTTTTASAAAEAEQEEYVCQCEDCTR